MKRFAIVLLILAVAAGAGYIWWQRNATRIINAQVQQLGRRFFTNPENLTVENAPVRVMGLNTARVPRMVISGKDLVLRDGPTLAYAKLVLTDATVTGPPFRLSKLASGSFNVRVTDSAVTQYIHERGGSLGGVKLIPLDTVDVKFVPGAAAQTIVKAEAKVAKFNLRLPITANGVLVPASTAGQIDLRIEKVKVSERFSVGVKEAKDALRVINPIVDFSSWPITTEFDSIKSGQGYIVVQGKFTGVERSLLH